MVLTYIRTGFDYKHYKQYESKKSISDRWQIVAVLSSRTVLSSETISTNTWGGVTLWKVDLVYTSHREYQNNFCHKIYILIGGNGDSHLQTIVFITINRQNTNNLFWLLQFLPRCMRFSKLWDNYPWPVPVQHPSAHITDTTWFLSW